MRRMRLVAPSGQKQNVESAQQVQRLARHVAVIGQVGRRSETETENGSFAVDYGHGLKTRPEQLNRTFNRLHFDLRQTAEFVVRVEDVAEHVAQKFSRARLGIQGQSARLVRE